MELRVRPAAARWAVLLAAATATTACAAPLWAVSPVGIDLRSFSPGFRSDAPLSEDADVAFLPWDNFYGVPWQSFMTGAPPPVSWAARLSAAVQMTAGWGKPVFLALPLGAGRYRGCPAFNATDGGNMDWPIVLPFTGCPSSGCYDWNPATNPAATAVRSAYVNFTLALATALKPAYLAVGTDVNLYAEGCGGAGTAGFTALVDFSNQVYTAVKAALPNTLVFPILQLESLMQIRAGQMCNGLGGGAGAPPPQLAACVNDSLTALSGLQRDAFAFSSYPHMTQAAAPGDGNPPWEAWYWPVVLDALSPADAARIVVAETGFVSDYVQLNFANGSIPLARAGAAGGGGPDVGYDLQCGAVIDASHADTEAWLAQVAKWAAQYRMPLVTWFSDMDMLYSTGDGESGSVATCPCRVPAQEAAYCAYLTAVRVFAGDGEGAVWAEFAAKMTGAMGLRYVDGQKRQPLYDDWCAARGLPPNDDDQPVDDDGHNDDHRDVRTPRGQRAVGESAVDGGAVAPPALGHRR